MSKFSKKDLVFSIITGLITGLIAWQVFVFLGVSVINLWNKSSCEASCTPEGLCTAIYCIRDYVISFSSSWLALIVPALWILGVNLGYFLGHWLAFFNQFGKFAAVGFTNAAVYFGILNILIAWSDINKGFWYSFFVAIAFIIGTVHSYFWNKFWVFSTEGGPAPGGEAANKIGGKEFGKFLGISVIAGLVNVGVASVLVNLMEPLFGLTSDQWANVGGVAGSAIALVFSFVGFKLTVFKK